MPMQQVCSIGEHVGLDDASGAGKFALPTIEESRSVYVTNNDSESISVIETKVG